MIQTVVSCPACPGVIYQSPRLVYAFTSPVPLHLAQGIVVLPLTPCPEHTGQVTQPVYSVVVGAVILASIVCEV